MPQIIIKGMKESDVATIAKPISEKLSEITNTPEDWFSIEYLPITFFVEGNITSHYPIIQVNWFDRGEEIKSLCAQEIDKIIRALGYSQIEIFFINIDKSNFYENGNKF